jgi:CRISPR-associated protein Cas1
MGMIMMNDDAEEMIDLPEQRMEEATTHSPPADGRLPVKLKPDALQRVIEAFEKKLTSTFYYALAQKQMNYEDAIIFQAAQYRKVIEGAAEVYQPLALK